MADHRIGSERPSQQPRCSRYLTLPQQINVHDHVRVLSEQPAAHKHALVVARFPRPRAANFGCGPVIAPRRYVVMKRRRYVVGYVAAGLTAYFALLRQPVLTWGATEAEAQSRLPGDELLDDADGVATRAIDIRAPTSAVWPWIAQMGPSPRGGAYTYDWIENLLGLNMHSVNTVLPEFQHPEVGDTIGFGPNRMRLERVDAERVLAWRSQDGNWVWTFVLNQTNGTTRLISRNRFRLPRLVDRIGMVPMEPASLLMERKMLLGIKQRAERLAVGAGEAST